MPAPEPFLVFTRVLNELGLRSMVSGGVAAIFYGEPRLTNDIDIIVTMTRRDVGALKIAFPADAYYRPPTEVIEAELGQRRLGPYTARDDDPRCSAIRVATGARVRRMTDQRRGREAKRFGALIGKRQE